MKKFKPHNRPKKKAKRKDFFYNKAKSDDYVARSAYKLEEIDRRAQLFFKGAYVVDFGCSPGSWLQYISNKVGPQGKVVGFDLSEVKVHLPNVITHQKDLLELNRHSPEFADQAYDLVVSDAMVHTSGNAEVDCLRSLELVSYLFNLSQDFLLKANGQFLAKIFEGPGFSEFYQEFKQAFSKTAIYRPQAIRKGSREVYVYGKSLHPQPTHS